MKQRHGSLLAVPTNGSKNATSYFRLFSYRYGRFFLAYTSAFIPILDYHVAYHASRFDWNASGLLDKKQAAAYLQISAEGLDNLRRQGHLKAHKIGVLCRFAVSDLADYLHRSQESSFVRTPRPRKPGKPTGPGEANVSERLHETRKPGPGEPGGGLRMLTRRAIGDK